MSRRTLIGIATALSMASSLGAQRRTDTLSKPSPTTANVRAELAAVLLQSKKYDDAAREYRALVARDAANVDYQLGLARALAWGGQPREAERELRILRTKRVPKEMVDTLLRSVREAMEPRSAEAMEWVAERPDYAPYRLALARAFAREHYRWASSAQYDTLLSRPGAGRVPGPLALRREQARVFLDAGDLFVGAARLHDVLRLAPTDTAVRHELANVLAAARQLTEARAQYDTLLSRAPTAALFIERARLRLSSGDRSGGELDLRASLDFGPTATTYLMLGDMYRERADYASAGRMYRAARDRLREQHASTASVLASIAGLAREARPVVAFAPAIGGDPGWRLSSDGVSDNLGVRFASSTLGGTLAIGDAIRVGVAGLHQYLGERSATRTIDLKSYGGEASLAGEVGYGSFLTRVGVTGGKLTVPDGPSIALGSTTAAVWWNAMELAFETSRGPAYPSLLTTTAIRPLTGNGGVLTERSSTVTLGGPIGAADVALTTQQSRLSDGNTRRTFQGYLRYPVAPNVFAVYTASSVAFSDRSLRYWDPFSYAAHGAGLELAVRSLSGLSWAARAVPGMAWSRELPPPAIRNLRTTSTIPLHHSAFQVGTSADLVWRDPHWDATAAVSYGRGRDGGYQRFGVTLGVRILP